MNETKKTYEWGKNTQFQSAKWCGDWDLCIAPAEFRCNGLKESGKPHGYRPANIKGDYKTGVYNEPAIKNSTQQNSSLKNAV